LNELIAAEPDRVRFRSVRARAHEALQGWREAAQDLRVATRLAPDNLYLWLRLAGSELASGDVAAYGRACAAITELRPGDESRSVMKLALKLVAYGSNSPAVLARLSAQLQSIPRSSEWRETGSLEFRLGRYENALRLLNDDSGRRVALLRAMTYSALGQRKQAEEWLEKGRTRTSHPSPDTIMGNDVPAYAALNELLLREAEAMIR